MKKISVIALTVLSTSVLAFGGDGNPHGHDNPHGERHRERMLNTMTDKLALTETQRSDIETVMREQHEKMRALREETHNRINALLTTEQQTKFAKMKEKRRERREER